MKKPLAEHIAQTKVSLAMPAPGDRFTEFEAFWVEVVAKEDDIIAVRETPCPIDATGLRFFKGIAAFQKAYSHPDGEPWVLYVDDGGKPWTGSLIQLMFKRAEKDQVRPEEMAEMVEKD